MANPTFVIVIQGKQARLAMQRYEYIHHVEIKFSDDKTHALAEIHSIIRREDGSETTRVNEVKFK